MESEYIHFYVDPQHFPYQFNIEELNIKNPNVHPLLISGTWLPWILRAYLELSEYKKISNPLKLVDYIPEEGITIFFRGSISLNQKPKKKQFWVCIVADAHWHPFSQINIFQNYLSSLHYPLSYFLRCWPPLNIKVSEGRKVLKNIFYFGHIDNLAKEFKEKDWQTFLTANNLSFKIVEREFWNDYRQADAVLAVREFNDKKSFLNKPASKLINSWIANTIFIGGKESAYEYEVSGSHDYIPVTSYPELKLKIIELKSNANLYMLYKKRSIENGKQFTIDFFRDEWAVLINNEIVLLYEKWKKKSQMAHTLFLAYRFFLFKKKSICFKLKKHWDSNIEYS